MPRRVLIGFWVGILSIWMQLFAPAAMMAMEQPVDPLAVICSHSADGASRQTGQHDHRHAHHCCPLCQCHNLGGLLPDNRPIFTTFDYPVVSPMRWRQVFVPVVVGDGSRLPQPRGPPVLV